MRAETTSARRRAVIVSHGQPSEPEIGEAEIRTLAEAIVPFAPDWDVRGATLAGPGALEAALAGAPDDLVVYPMFMADGWFTQDELPRRLGDAPARRLPPFGLDPALPGFAADWLKAEIASRGWSPATTRLFVAAHGSGRSKRPAEVTRAFAAALGAHLPLAETRCGFVEEEPYLADMARDLGQTSICLPFFAARRGHVLDDLPEALDEVGFAGIRLDPVGLHPGIPAFIARRLQAAADAALL